MTLSFDVKEHEDGWLLRDVLRARLVSASLLTQLKNTDGIRVDGAAPVSYTHLAGRSATRCA